MSKMLEEIREQPATLERTLAEARSAVAALRRRLEQTPPRLVVLVARGTSDNAAVFGRYLIPISTGLHVSLAAPSTLTLYGSELDYRDTLVVGISQSGESTDTNFVLERARHHGAITVGITNEASSSTARLAEHVFLVHAGREKSVAATKTYTGQLLMLYLLAHALGARFSLDDLAWLPDRVAEALKLERAIAVLAPRYCFMRHAVVVGRGLNYANAFEFALKLMETCYVVAERFSSADFLHGPIAMVEPSFPAFLFAPAGVTWPAIRDLTAKLDQLKAETLIITDRGNPEAARHLGHSIILPSLRTRKRTAPVDLYTPIPYVIPAQLLAACLAKEKGFDPDHPRTLTNVTRTL
jgi:glucosamine--fructose-6-phosphate aminotransferase (isomerizing)